MTSSRGVLRTIRSSDGRVAPHLRALWSNRILLGFLVRREIGIRYQQTLIGVAWVLLQPALTVLLLVIVFGRFSRSMGWGERSPYGLNVLCGILLWNLFSNSVGSATLSFVNNVSLVTKVPMPRILLPAAAIGVALFDFCVASTLLALAFPMLGGQFGGWMLASPLFVFFAAVVALGIGAGASVLAAEFRDVRHAVPFLLQVWFLATPVIYPFGMVSDRWRALLSLNPLSGAVEGFRSAVLGSPCDWPLVIVSAATGGLCSLIGLLYYARAEARLADVV